jgi:hypothetical protein
MAEKGIIGVHPRALLVFTGLPGGVMYFLPPISHKNVIGKFPSHIFVRSRGGKWPLLKLLFNIRQLYNTRLSLQSSSKSKRLVFLIYIKDLMSL